MKVRIQESFWNIFPEAQISVLVVKGIENRERAEDFTDFTALLAYASQKSRSFINEENFTQSPVVQEWRRAFTKFKTKKGARSSIEALLKRVHQGREFHPINPLVDFYNCVSLSYALPCGGEDLEALRGDLCLGLAQGGESFCPLGAEEDAPALPGEMIYYDEGGAVCRCLNWREAQRTMLSEETRDAILVIEAVTDEQIARAQQAIQELKKRLEEYFGVEGEIHHLTIHTPEIEIIM